MPFIQTIAPNEADPEVKTMYDRERQYLGYVPDYAKVFCHRPGTMQLWAELHRGIRKHLAKKYYELATYAAAVELKSTGCSLVHGRKLEKFYPAACVVAIARGENWDNFSELEKGIVALARKVARDATTVEQRDIQILKEGGLNDGEIFDVVATAAGRAFITKLAEGLGARSAKPQI